MLHTLSKNIADFLLSKDCFEEENLSIYIYGTELVISSAIGALLILTLSLITNNLITGLLFYISFNTLRAYIGGLHCKTYLKCNTTFVFVFMFCLISESFIKDYMYRQAVLLLIVTATLAMITILAPIENPNKPIAETDRKKYKIISIIIYILHLALYFMLTYMFAVNADIIIITDFISSVLMIIGLINNRRCKYEND